MSAAATFVYVSDADDGTIDAYAMDVTTGARAANPVFVTIFAAVHESTFGTKRTSPVALHMSAFGGKADMT